MKLGYQALLMILMLLMIATVAYNEWYTAMVDGKFRASMVG